MATLRIGTLGAARITPGALVKPARRVEGVAVAAVAARDPRRAGQFATKHGIGTVHDTYEQLLADPDLDAVYNPLPNGLHAQWTLAALAAGKHVLCEKPFTNNAEEADEVRRAADASGKVVMEAFHWRYHPLAERMISILRGGELGTLRHLESWVCFPLPSWRDIRYRYELGGGATMDAGCYAIHMARTLSGAEPVVVSARAKLASKRVDRAMSAGLRFPDGATGRITCSMLSSDLLRVAVRATGDAGTMDVRNPLAPHLGSKITVRSNDQRRTERVRGESTYTFQLRAFRDAVHGGDTVLTPPNDSVANMAVIDAVYRAAGLPLRGE